jgi:hypothetical protein
MHETDVADEHGICQFHRGTYTSHGKRECPYPSLHYGCGRSTLSLRRPGSIKKGNRKSEILLRDAEVGAAPNFDLVCPLSLTCS